MQSKDRIRVQHILDEAGEACFGQKKERGLVYRMTIKCNINFMVLGGVIGLAIF